MHPLLTPQERKAMFREWLYQLPITHVGTLNVLPKHRNENDMRQIYQRFEYKLNKKVWAGNSYKSGKRIGMVGFLHARRDIDDEHIHIAFWGFPLQHTEQQLECKFMDAAKHTTGVLYKEQCWPRRGNTAVHFEPQLSGGWMNYCSRFLADSSDTNCLIDLSQLPVNTHHV